MTKFIYIFLSLILFSCHSDNDTTIIPPIAQLPAATQIGANTFGCLLDGQIFKPGIYSSSYQCFYQFVDGGYYFNVNANNRKNSILTSLIIATAKLQIQEGQTYNLYEKVDGNACGGLFIGNSNTGIIQNYYTSAESTGELKITKLDFTHNIVSGTFWYDIKDNQNVIHQIRNGRFDMRFTQ